MSTITSISNAPRTGNFYDNVMTVLRRAPGGALRLDILASQMHQDPHQVLTNLRLAEMQEENGLATYQFELISAREQEGYGFSREAFPRAVMPEKTGLRKRTRKQRADVGEAAGTEEKKQVNYWPIVAVKDESRASKKANLARLADSIFALIKEQFPGDFDVFYRPGSKSLTVKFSGVQSDSTDDVDDEDISAIG